MRKKHLGLQDYLTFPSLESDSGLLLELFGDPEMVMAVEFGQLSSTLDDILTAVDKLSMEDKVPLSFVFAVAN
jgi:hypothetical protein